MVHMSEMAKQYGMVDAVERILDQRSSFTGVNKAVLFLVLSCALVMMFQGKNYKNLCLSVLVGLGMVAADPGICNRLLDLGPCTDGTALAPGGPAKVFASKLVFGVLCLVTAYLINMCILPMVWIVSAILCYYVAKETFTEELRNIHALRVFLNIWILFLSVSSIRSFEKTKLAVYSLVFSVCGSTIVWICLEAILEEDLGLDAFSSVVFEDGGGSIFGIPQIYPFLVLIGVGIMSQVKFDNVLSMYRKRQVVSITVRRSGNKVIEI